jgi:quercetin 2,3-dioxygenase
MEKSKTLLGIYESASSYWVGDGFPVRNLFPSNPVTQDVNPFLLLDYAGPHEFPATGESRGVGEHPHRGFETVSIAYQGKVCHRDSAGNAGTIGPGDVQWMTAASGVVHEEKLDPGFLKRGGVLEMIQLWVNLPRAFKMTEPRYQTLTAADIPVAILDDAGSLLRVIAGEWNGNSGPAKTFTPIQLYDVRLKPGAKLDMRLPPAMNTSLFLMKGALSTDGSLLEGQAKLAVFSAEGETVALEALEDSAFLVLAGTAIDEPVAQQGPFVMNTRQELLQAVEDYRSGKMGHLD